MSHKAKSLGAAIFYELEIGSHRYKSPAHKDIFEALALFLLWENCSGDWHHKSLRMYDFPFIISERFGLGDDKPKTFRAIGLRLGLCSSTIQAKQWQAIRILSHPSRTRLLFKALEPIGIAALKP